MIKRLTYLLTFLVFAQCALGQEPYVELIVEPSNPRVGEPITVTVKANMNGDINIDLPKYFVNGNNEVNGLEQGYDPNSGRMETYLYYSKSGSMCKAGTFTFGPAFVNVGRKVYHSNKVTVKVVESIASSGAKCNPHQLKRAAFGQIEVSKKSVYCGEPVTAQAKVLSKFQPSHYESYQPYEVKPSLKKHSINEKSGVKLRLETVGGQERFVFDLDQQVIFPVRSGKVKFKPFELTLQSGFDSYPLQSDPISIEVKELPKDGKPKSFQGAVGTYTLTREFMSSPEVEGDVLSFVLTLKGSGNLHDVSAPRLELGENFKIYGDPEVEESIRFTERGATGQMKITYHVQVLASGNVKLPVYEYAYFDPKEETYKTVQLEEVEMNINESDVFVQEDIQPDLQVSENAVVWKDENQGAWYTNKYVRWVGGSLPILALLFLIYTRLKDKETSETSVQSAKVESNEIVEDPTFDVEKALRSLTTYQAINDTKGYFDSISRSLNAMLSLKLFGESNLMVSVSDVESRLPVLGLDEETIGQIKDILVTAQSVKYANHQPADSLEVYTRQFRAISTALNKDS